jgi:hypothetical protein
VAPRTTLFAVLLTLLLCSCMTIRSWLYRPPPRPPAPNASLLPSNGEASIPSFATKVPGPGLRALSLAVGHFSAQINPYSEDLLARCLSRPEAYDAQIIREEADRWVIYVRPRAERCWDGGERLMGSDGKYEIHKGDFRILSAEFGE